MPPWEVMRWLAGPTDSVTVIAASGSINVAADSNRVALMIGLGQATGSLNVALASGNIGALGGLNLNPGQPPFLVTLRDHGVWVTSGWIINNVTAAPVNAYVLSLTVKEWPDEQLPPEAALWEAVGELTRSIRLLTDALGRM